MATLQRPFSVPLLVLLVAFAASPGRASTAGAQDLLVLQATARMAADLAAGNYCAGIELKPRIEAVLRYLSAGPVDDPLVTETATVLTETRYDAVPCDTPCPPAAVAVPASDEPFGPAATAKQVAALNEIVTQWLRRAEADPPMISIAVSRYSHDPLPLYLPGQPVNYLVHVGPSCHGAMLFLDRPYELPGSFDGAGSFIPDRDGLWSIHIVRRDGLTLSPLTYLSPETGLPSYYQEFWVGTEAVKSLGPGSPIPWER